MHAVWYVQLLVPLARFWETFALLPCCSRHVRSAPGMHTMHRAPHPLHSTACAVSCATHACDVWHIACSGIHQGFLSLVVLVDLVHVEPLWSLRMHVA